MSMQIQNRKGKLSGGKKKAAQKRLHVSRWIAVLQKLRRVLAQKLLLLLLDVNQWVTQ